MNVQLVYFLLCGRYANDIVAAADLGRFKEQLFSIMFQYGPTWFKKLSVQKELRKLDVAAFQKGATSIANNASNPSTTPSTLDTEELPYVNQQNVNKTTRSLADGYALMLSLLEDDVSEEFLSRFKKLFLTVVQPEAIQWFKTYPDDPNYTDEPTDPGNIYDGVGLTRGFRNLYFSQVFPDVETFVADWNSTIYAAYLEE